MWFILFLDVFNDFEYVYIYIFYIYKYIYINIYIYIHTFLQSFFLEAICFVEVCKHTHARNWKKHEKQMTNTTSTIKRSHFTFRHIWSRSIRYFRTLRTIFDTFLDLFNILVWADFCFIFDCFVTFMKSLQNIIFHFF